MASTKINNRSKSLITVLVILGFVVIANYVLTRKFVRLDFTEQKAYSIAKPTKTVLKGLDDIVNIKVFISKNLPTNVRSLEQQVRDILTEYKAYAGKNLRISYEDPSESDDAKQKAVSMGIQEFQMQTFEKDKAQVVNGFFGIAILYADKKEVMPVIQDVQNFEYDMTQAIMKVFRTVTPTVGVLKTDTMPNIPPQMRQRMDMSASVEEKYKPLFENLRKNYTVQTVNLKESKTIAPEVKTLVVPGGENFSDYELYIIDQYFMKGGNLIVLVDAMKQNLQNQYGMSVTPIYPAISRLLEHYGARVENNLVLDASCGAVQVPQRMGMFQMNVSMPYPYFVQVTGKGFNQKNPAVASLRESMLFPWPSSITVLARNGDSLKVKDTSGVTASILIQSSPKSWTMTDGFNLDPRQQGWGPRDGIFKQSTLGVYLSGSFTSYFAGKPVPSETGDTSAAALMQAQASVVPSNQGGHLVVVSNSQFCMPSYATGGNQTFMQNIVDLLTLNENLISIRSRTASDRPIQKDQIAAGSAKPQIIRWVNILLMPLALAIVGLIIFFKRRAAKPAAAPTAGGKN